MCVLQKRTSNMTCFLPVVLFYTLALVFVKAQDIIDLEWTILNQFLAVVVLRDGLSLSDTMFRLYYGTLQESAHEQHMPDRIQLRKWRQRATVVRLVRFVTM
jgi:hypothetical protein